MAAARAAAWWVRWRCALRRGDFWGGGGERSREPPAAPRADLLSSGRRRLVHVGGEGRRGGVACGQARRRSRFESRGRPRKVLYKAYIAYMLFYVF